MVPTTNFLNGRLCYGVVKKSSKYQPALRDNRDFGFYFRLLKKYKTKFGIKIYAFCILPDTVYLIIQPELKNNIEPFITRLQQLYTQYYLAKYNEDRGSIWPRLRYALIDNDRALMAGIKSLGFRPVKAELSGNPVSYPWSSCSYRVFNSRNGLLDS